MRMESEAMWLSWYRMGTHEGKKPLRRTRRRREDNITVDLKEIELEGVDWIDLAQDMEKWRGLVKMVIRLGIL
jgi:hypothetical protein